MSTKTMFKRLALVTVSALGFGMLTAVSPANAAATASFSVDKSSITVVTAQAGASDSMSAVGAIFKITLRNVGATATSQYLQIGETLTASVVGVPATNPDGSEKAAATAIVGDLRFAKGNPTDDNGNPYASPWTDGTESSTTSVSWGYADSATAKKASAASAALTNSYYFAVTAAAADAINAGEYTIRLRLTSENNSILVQDSLVKVKFVSSAINSGAKITAAVTGTINANETFTTYTALKNIRATITDANDGRLVVEASAGTVTVPTLLIDLVNSSNVPIDASDSTKFEEVDDASTADNAYTTTTTGFANEAAANKALNFNGTYGIKATETTAFPTAAVGTTNKLRVRYGATTAYATLTIVNAAAGTGTATVEAVGLTLASASPSWTLPLTTKTAVLKVSGGTPGNAVVFTATWTGAATGDQTPLASTPTTAYFDANGIASLTITNANPIKDSNVVVSISGMAENPAAQTITWKASEATTVSVSLDGAVVALKSTNVFVATVTDVFGGPVAGVVMRPSVGAGANYSATRTYTSLVTDANGQVSYSLTDALAVATDTDSVSFTQVVSSGSGVTNSATITYAAAAPAPTTLNAFYSTIALTTESRANTATAVPTTGIYETATTLTAFGVEIARDNTRPITPTIGKDHLLVRINAGVGGAAVTATASEGAYVLSAASLQATSRTKYTSNSTATLGDVYFVVGSNKAGANTITFTSGSATKTVAFWTESDIANARFVTLTGPATGTANGDLLAYTVAVTDRYGNPMEGANLTIAASGVAVLGGGSTLTSFTTDSTGTFTFTGTSFSSAGGAGSYTVNFTNSGTDKNSAAGYVGATQVESTLAAGNSTATLSVTFAAGTSAAADAATAAADAALEAIDAANAATDAANLAAEAADAATVAAEEARDAADAATAAVEALASEMATLFAALKAQLTTLAKTVAKIAKKVRA